MLYSCQKETVLAQSKNFPSDVLDQLQKLMNAKNAENELWQLIKCIGGRIYFFKGFIQK